MQDIKRKKEMSKLYQCLPLLCLLDPRYSSVKSRHLTMQRLAFFQCFFQYSVDGMQIVSKSVIHLKLLH